MLQRRVAVLQCSRSAARAACGWAQPSSPSSCREQQCALPTPKPHCLQNRVAVLQSLSGTGSLRLGAAFIAKFLPGTTVYVSNPTWGNHNNIFADAGVKVGPLMPVSRVYGTL
jgi:Aminotransferase class I and II